MHINTHIHNLCSLCPSWSLLPFSAMLLPMTTHTYTQGLWVYSKMAQDFHLNVTNNYHVVCKHTHLHPQTNISLDFLDSTHSWVETQMCLYFRWEDVLDVPLWFNISAAFCHSGWKLCKVRSLELHLTPACLYIHTHTLLMFACTHTVTTILFCLKTPRYTYKDTFLLVTYTSAAWSTYLKCHI